jgi:hypothetical protein
METMDDLLRRASEARARLVRTEIDAAAALVARAERLTDSQERVRCLREARATVAFAARIAGAHPLPDDEEVTKRLDELGLRLDALSSVYVRSRLRARAG